MALDGKQKRVLAGMLAAVALTAVVFAVPFGWPAQLLGATPSPGARLAFALRADVFVLLWPLAMTARIAQQRFFSPQDIDGSGLSSASQAVAVNRAVLENTVEQTLLAVGAHLALAVSIAADHLLLVPILVGTFALGRALFWFGYARGAGGRSFGFAATFYPTVAAYIFAVLLVIGR